jgi:hypothetical protein
MADFEPDFRLSLRGYEVLNKPIKDLSKLAENPSFPSVHDTFSLSQTCPSRMHRIFRRQDVEGSEP